MDHPTDDRALLREYVERGSQPAFAALVHRHAALVHSAALRQTRDPHLADDVTQAVFLMLAQRAARIGPHVTLAGWLYNAARYAAANARRAAERRRLHELNAAQPMNTTPPAPPNPAAPDWSEIEPHLDVAMSRLRPTDRDAVLLRYFQDKPLREVALALNVSEDAAKQRCLRALDKLRRLLGQSASPAALPTLLSLHAASTAPPAHILSAASSIGTAATPLVAFLAKGALTMMTRAKLKLAVAASLVATVLVAGTARVAVALAPTAAPPPPPAAAAPVSNLPHLDVPANTPRATWVELVGAWVAADGTKFTSLLHLDPDEAKVAATVVAAQADFQKALHAAFPAAPQVDNDLPPASIRMFRRQTPVDAVIEDTAGDDSTVHGPGGMDLFFKRIDGVWKLDLTRKPALENDPNFRKGTGKVRWQFARDLAKMASTYRAATKKLAAHAYATPHDAWTDVRLSSLPGGDGSPASKPAPAQPAIAVQTEDYAAVRARFRTKPGKSATPIPSDSPVAKPIFPDAPPGARIVEYKSGDLLLKAWLSAPSPTAPGKHPAVIFLHNLRGLQSDEWLAVQPFRDANFVLLAPSLRGEYGQPGSNSGYYQEVDDVLAAAAYVKTLPDVDPDRVFLVGLGYSAPIALLATEASPTFRAVTAHFGLHDLRLLYNLMPPEDRAKFSFDTADPHEFEVRSPLAYAASIKSPARLYYSHNDPFLTPTTLRLAEVAKEHHLDVTATDVPGDAKSAITESFRRALVFFQEHL